MLPSMASLISDIAPEYSGEPLPALHGAAALPRWYSPNDF